MSSSRSVARVSQSLLRSASQSGSRISLASTSASASGLGSASGSAPASTSSTSRSTAPLHTSAARRAEPGLSEATAATASSAAPPAASGAVAPPPNAEPRSPLSHLPRLARKDAALYAQLRPPPLSAIAALAARLSLLPSSLDAETRSRRIQLVHRACTHPSFLELVQKAAELGDGLQLEASGPGLVRRLGESQLDSLQYPSSLLVAGGDASTTTTAATTTHTALATVGNSLLGMIASEFLHLRYPNLPTRVLKAAVSAYVGPSTLADVGGEIGLGGQGILRWNREARVLSKVFPSASAPKGAEAGAAAAAAPARSRGLLSRDVSADAMRALVAVIFQELGLSAARHFITTHFLTRNLDLSALLKFVNPKRVLSATCTKYGREAPQSRLLAESGRLSIHPIFVVGVYSGTHKIGEGNGSSIKMAEFRAAEDALRRLYLTQTPWELLHLPSSTLDTAYPPKDGREPFLPSTGPTLGRTGAYKPLPLGGCEVLEAAGKDRR